MGDMGIRMSNTPDLWIKYVDEFGNIWQRPITNTEIEQEVMVILDAMEKERLTENLLAKNVGILKKED